MPKKPKAPATVKPTPMPPDESTISDELREAQKAYLLLQLLDAENQTLTRGEANKFPDLLKADKISLNFLKSASANYRRDRLAETNYLSAKMEGRATVYSLLPDGLEYLAACVSRLNNFRFRISGKTLNALITAARDTSFSSAPTTMPTKHAVMPPSATQLADAVLADFDELRRERFSGPGLVPIHEVRRRIGDRFGPAAASHGVLDEVILSLWREKRIGLEGISDLGSATEQQLSDSIPGEGSTIFYLEVPREQPSLV